MLKFLISSLITVSPAALLKAAQQKKENDAHFITTALAFQTQLRICNAYPFAKDGVQVFDQQLEYGACTEIQREVQEKEQIDFFTMQKQVLLGSFEIQTIPRQNTLMMVVIQPHDATSTGVAFQSHAFADAEEAQIALLDAFVGGAGPTASSTLLVDIKDQGDARRNEKLRMSSVVAVNPGSYEIGLGKTHRQVTAGGNERISVIRIGSGKDYPESLIVYPTSGAASLSGAVALVIMTLMAVMQ